MVCFDKILEDQNKQFLIFSRCRGEDERASNAPAAGGADGAQGQLLRRTKFSGRVWMRSAPSVVAAAGVVAVVVVTVCLCFYIVVVDAVAIVIAVAIVAVAAAWFVFFV